MRYSFVALLALAACSSNQSRKTATVETDDNIPNWDLSAGFTEDGISAGLAKQLRTKAGKVCFVNETSLYRKPDLETCPVKKGFAASKGSLLLNLDLKDVPQKQWTMKTYREEQLLSLGLPKPADGDPTEDYWATPIEIAHEGIAIGQAMRLTQVHGSTEAVQRTFLLSLCSHAYSEACRLNIKDGKLTMTVKGAKAQPLTWEAR